MKNTFYAAARRMQRRGSLDLANLSEDGGEDFSGSFEAVFARSASASTSPPPSLLAQPSPCSKRKVVSGRVGAAAPARPNRKSRCVSLDADGPGAAEEPEAPGPVSRMGLRVRSVSDDLGHTRRVQQPAVPSPLRMAVPRPGAASRDTSPSPFRFMVIDDDLPCGSDESDGLETDCGGGMGEADGVAPLTLSPSSIASSVSLALAGVSFPVNAPSFRPDCVVKTEILPAAPATPRRVKTEGGQATPRRRGSKASPPHTPCAPAAVAPVHPPTPCQAPLPLSHAFDAFWADSESCQGALFPCGLVTSFDDECGGLYGAPLPKSLSQIHLQAGPSCPNIATLTLCGSDDALDIDQTLESYIGSDFF